MNHSTADLGIPQLKTGSKSTLPPLRGFREHSTRSLTLKVGREALVKKVESADINVISQTGALGQSPANFPIYQYQDRLIKMFQSDPHWHVIATYTDPS